MKTSLIITACNEGTELLRTIESVRATTKRPHEIIVVDDGSTDESCLGLDVERCIRHEKRQGVAPSRLDGAAGATGDCLVFLDGHHKFDGPCIDHIVQLALEKRAIVWPCIKGYVDDKKRDRFAHGALLRTKSRDPKKDGLLGNSWYSKNRPANGGYTRAFGLLIPYAIPASIFDKVRWHRGMMGLGNSELAVATKAFFTEVDIFHSCAYVSRHLFRNAPPYDDCRWLHWLHNSALTARICFTDGTWHNHWWPTCYAGKHRELTKERFDAPDIVKQQAAFARIKRRPDSELWRGLLNEPVPPGVSDE